MSVPLTTGDIAERNPDEILAAENKTMATAASTSTAPADDSLRFTDENWLYEQLMGPTTCIRKFLKVIGFKFSRDSYKHDGDAFRKDNGKPMKFDESQLRNILVERGIPNVENLTIDGRHKLEMWLRRTDIITPSIHRNARSKSSVDGIEYRFIPLDTDIKNDTTTNNNIVGLLRDMYWGNEPVMLCIDQKAWLLPGSTRRVDKLTRKPKKVKSSLPAKYVYGEKEIPIQNCYLQQIRLLLRDKPNYIKRSTNVSNDPNAQLAFEMWIASCPVPFPTFVGAETPAAEPMGATTPAAATSSGSSAVRSGVAFGQTTANEGPKQPLSNSQGHAASASVSNNDTSTSLRQSQIEEAGVKKSDPAAARKQATLSPRKSSGDAASTYPPKNHHHSNSAPAAAAAAGAGNQKPKSKPPPPPRPRKSSTVTAASPRRFHHNNSTTAAGNQSPKPPPPPPRQSSAVAVSIGTPPPKSHHKNNDKEPRRDHESSSSNLQIEKSGVKKFATRKQKTRPPPPPEENSAVAAAAAAPPPPKILHSSNNNNNNNKKKHRDQESISSSDESKEDIVLVRRSCPNSPERKRQKLLEPKETATTRAVVDLMTDNNSTVAAAAAATATGNVTPTSERNASPEAIPSPTPPAPHQPTPSLQATPPAHTANHNNNNSNSNSNSNSSCSNNQMSSAEDDDFLAAREANLQCEKKIALEKEKLTLEENKIQLVLLELETKKKEKEWRELKEQLKQYED